MRRAFPAMLILLLAARVAWPLTIEVDGKGHLVIPRPEGVFAVNLAGGTARRLADPQKGRPSVARPSPDGSKVLVVEVLDAKTRKEKKVGHEVFLVDAVGGGVRSLGAFRSVGHVAWSPDSKRVSVSVLGGKQPALHVITLAGDKVTTLTGTYRDVHDWIDNDEVVAITFDRGRGDVTHRGQLVRINVLEDKFTEVAKVECGNRTTVDVSPDGKKVLVITRVHQRDPQLTVVSLPEGNKQTLVPEDVSTAAWSPDSRRIVLIARVQRKRKETVKAPGGFGGTFTVTRRDRIDQLTVCDPDGDNSKGVADKPAVKFEFRRVIYFSADLGGELLQPSWLDRHTVLYFHRKGVYGDAGTALHLMSVKYNGTSRTDLQLTIDKAIADVLK
jgi:dipeptidyl aminopeptidase/acylaminoacyl peptidase